MLKRLTLPALALMLAVWLLAACGTTPAPVSTNTPVPTATPEPSPTPLSALSLLQVAEDIGNKEPFHVEMDMVMTMTLPAAGISQPLRVPMRAVGDVQPPDSTHMTMTISMQGMSIDTEIVTISNTTYVKDPTTGNWQTTTQAASPVSPGELTSFKPEQIVELSIVGEEELDGTAVYHLSGKANMPLALGEPVGTVTGTMEVDYWIEKETNRIRKATLAGDIPIAGNTPGTVSMSIAATMSNYGERVVIKAPEGQ